MGHSDLAICVNKSRGLGTLLPLDLTFSEELTTVDAAIEIGLRVIKRDFKFLHEEFGSQFVFPVI